jgi:hypothetical protein
MLSFNTGHSSQLRCFPVLLCLSLIQDGCFANPELNQGIQIQNGGPIQAASDNVLPGPLDLLIARDGFSGLSGQICVIKPDKSFTVNYFFAGKTGELISEGRLSDADYGSILSATRQNIPETLASEIGKRKVNTGLIQITYQDREHKLWFESPVKGTLLELSAPQEMLDGEFAKFVKFATQLQSACRGFTFMK